MILATMEEEKQNDLDAFVQKPQHEGYRDMTVVGLAERLDRFSRICFALYEQHTISLIEGQILLSHEITRRIHFLLFERKVDAFWKIYADPCACYSVNFPEPWSYVSEYPGTSPDCMRNDSNPVIQEVWKPLEIDDSQSDSPHRLQLHKLYDTHILLHLREFIDYPSGRMANEESVRRLRSSEGRSISPSEPHPGGVSSDSNGSGPQTAIPVRSVGEEYDWVVTNLPDARLVDQALTFFDGKPFDVLTVAVGSSGERRVFFDISSFYDREREKCSPVAPCPYCGAALRTEKAKQCFECGMDWRDPTNVIRRGSA